MLGALTEKMQQIFSKLSKERKLTEENIADAVREVRLALLEADVNYNVVKNLIKRIKEKAIGAEVLKAVSPSQQFIKIVHDELVALMGGDEPKIQLKGNPSILMVCGLQGSGKTTHCVKLASFLRKKNHVKKPLIAACDLQRPAAIEQLRVLGGQAGVSVFSLEEEKNPLIVAQKAVEFAKSSGNDLVILDTAGRLHIDESLMQELEILKQKFQPAEILFVANATTGQDAVNIAAEFNRRLDITGTVLTMLDGNARAGAAIAINEVTGKPLKFEGIGEKIEDLQLFNPSSMADRILGMGDTINLVKKAQEHFDEKEAKEMEKKLRSASFTYIDYLKQIQAVKKMGSLKSLMKMLPGASNIKALDQLDDKQLFKVEAIILSMTPKEREGKDELIPSRRERVAGGSGTSINDVNKLVKSFKEAKKFMKNMPNMKQMQKMMGGSLWR
ncbi:MAG: signal recognition particle protein [Chlamydiales bacterium]